MKTVVILYLNAKFRVTFLKSATVLGSAEYIDCEFMGTKIAKFLQEGKEVWL